jgi:mRNA interferase MazF
MSLFNPGDVVVTDFPGVTGLKRRPAVVLSSDAYHVVRPDLILGLITSQTTAAIGPTDCILHDGVAAGLRRPSAFRAFIATLPRSSVPAPIGRLSETDWRAVRACVKLALAPLDDPAIP